MKKQKILTLWIFAHANAWKTTITENLLHFTKVIDKIWKVDNWNTSTDDLNIEQQRGISVRSSLVSFNIDELKIQLVDTPWHIDFSAEVEKSISILDMAILVVSWADWIEPQTYTIWNALKQKNIPILIFINKLDRIWADYEKTIFEIKNELTKNVVSLENIENKKNLIIQDRKEEELIEDISKIDDETLKKVLKNKEEITKNWLNKRISLLINQKKLIPIIWWSSLKNIWTDKIIKCIKLYFNDLEINSESNFSWLIYLIRNENNKRNLYTKILSGTLNLRDNIKIWNGKIWKVKNIYWIEWTKFVSKNSAIVWEIVILNWLNVNLWEYIWEKIDDKLFSFVNPLLVMEVENKQSWMMVELVESLKILNDEDSYLNIKYDKNTWKIYISLMWLIQAEIVQELLKTRFWIETIFKNPLVKHKETPTIIWKAEASYTQFSAIEFTITPLKRWVWIVYNSKLSTDYLHKKYQTQAEKLVKKYIVQWLFWWELTDIEISLTNWKFNSAGSSPSHFNIITPIALMRAIKKSKIKILEPISKFKLITPTKNFNQVIKSLNSKTAIYEIKEENKDKTILEWEINSKNIINYNVEIVELTSGKWSFNSKLLKYEISKEQNIEMPYYGLDPRNETKFIKQDMKWSLEVLDLEWVKKKKASRSKFKRGQM